MITWLSPLTVYPRPHPHPHHPHIHPHRPHPHPHNRPHLPFHVTNIVRVQHMTIVATRVPGVLQHSYIVKGCCCYSKIFPKALLTKPSNTL